MLYKILKCHYTLSRFILVGIVNTIFGMVIMAIFYNVLNIGYWLCTSLAYVMASILSFFLNKYYTFKVIDWSSYIVFSYILNIFICYGVANIISKPMIYCILSNYNQTLKDNIAMLLGMCIFTGLNYIGQKYFVFKKAV